MNLARAIEAKNAFKTNAEYLVANLTNNKGPVTITNVSKSAYWYDVWGQIDEVQSEVLNPKPEKEIGYKLREDRWRVIDPGAEFDSIDQVQAAIDDEVLYFIAE